MKKYITTDKHPELKEGLIMESEEKQPAAIYLNNNGELVCIYIEQNIDDGIEKGHIKEVEEKEFTKTDLLYFASAMKGDYVSAEEVDKFFRKNASSND